MQWARPPCWARCSCPQSVPGGHHLLRGPSSLSGRPQAPAQSARRLERLNRRGNERFGLILILILILFLLGDGLEQHDGQHDDPHDVDAERHPENQ